MYDSIIGVVTEKKPHITILDTGSICYAIHTPLTVFHSDIVEGEKIRFYTQFVVKEDSQRLFGFLSRKERELFIKVYSVSGIGPKSALSLISHLPGGKLAEAITQENTTALCSAPGIGKKTAQRLSLEMKDALITMSLPSNDIPEVQRDAIHALVHLGYTKQKAENAIKKAEKDIGNDAPLSTLITTALRYV